MRKMNRRDLLSALGLVGAGAVLTPKSFMSGLGASIARAQAPKNFIFIRTVFDFRNEGRTTFGADLAPLSPWSSDMAVITGLSHNGDGSEYHNGKQIRFATSCTPASPRGSNRTSGGGAFDGKSYDVVVGEHLQSMSGARNPYLILGAYPYNGAGIGVTFGTISFVNRNQYIVPEYRLDNIRSQILTHGGACGMTVPEVPVAALNNENLVIEAVMRDFQRSRAARSVDIRNQVEALEAQFETRRRDNIARIEGAPMCMPLRDTPLGHSYSRHSIISADFDTRVREMNHAGALALKTGFTNVVTLNYNFSGHGQPGVPGFHNYTHPGGFARAPTGDELNRLDGLSAFQVQMFAHLLRELTDYGILEDTMVVYSPHERPIHNHRDVPVLAFGARTTGTHRRGVRVQDMGKDILEHFGVPNAANFGGETARGGVL